MADPWKAARDRVKGTGKCYFGDSFEQQARTLPSTSRRCLLAFGPKILLLVVFCASVSVSAPLLSSSPLKSLSPIDSLIASTYLFFFACLSPTKFIRPRLLTKPKSYTGVYTHWLAVDVPFRTCPFHFLHSSDPNTNRNADPIRSFPLFVVPLSVSYAHLSSECVWAQLVCRGTDYAPFRLSVSEMALSRVTAAAQVVRMVFLSYESRAHATSGLRPYTICECFGLPFSADCKLAICLHEGVSQPSLTASPAKLETYEYFQTACIVLVLAVRSPASTSHPGRGKNFR